MYHNNLEDIKLAKEDKDQMAKLVNNNVGLVWNIVKRFSGRGYELEDLYQIGCIGLIKAIQRFDTNFEVQLSTYAVPYILGEIKRFIRDDGIIKVSRSTKELAIKIKEAQQEFLKKNNRDITVSELEEILQVSKEEISFALDAIRPVDSLYAEDSKGSEDDRKVIDKISNGKDETSNIVDKIALKQMIENLNEREKQIILLRFYKEKTQAQVGKILGITQVQVSRIERKVLDGMKSKLEAV